MPVPGRANSKWVKTIVAVATALVAMAPFAVPASAADFTPIASTWTTAATTYRAIPAKGWVQVSITLKVTNQTQDTYETYPCTDFFYDPYWGLTPYASTCTRTKRWYVDSTSVFTESGASDVRATSSAGKVTLHSEPVGFGDTIKHYTLTFPRIFNGRTRTITVTYKLRQRAALAGSGRINGAYVSFGGLAQPVDSASVRMIVPVAFDTSTAGGRVTESRSGSSRVYASGPISDASSFYVIVTGTNLAGYQRESILSPEGRPIQIESWPGDVGWLGAVRAEAASSIGKLEAAIGRPLPGSGPITIREVAGGTLGDAYSGAFDPDEDIARIPESYQQPGTVAHELSHTWFNGSMFEAQWLSEGYAQWAERAVGANTTTCPGPNGFVGASSGVELATWKYASPRATKAELDAVEAEYDASCAIVAEIATEIGPDRMRDVLAVLSAANAAYPGTHDAVIGAPNDWRAWLDAVDEVGMIPAGLDATSDAANLLIKYGAATEGDLVGRADARAALAVLRQTAGTWWTIPAAIYQPFATWDFTTATRAMDEMDATVRGSWQVLDVLPQLRDVETPLKARVAAATTLADLSVTHETVNRQVDTAQQLSGALDRVHAEFGPIEQLGLVEVDFGPIEASAVAHVGSLDLDAAEAEVAVIDATLSGATNAGLIRVGGALAVMSLVLLAIFFVGRQRRRAAPAAFAAVPDASEAIETVPTTSATSSDRRPGA